MANEALNRILGDAGLSKIIYSLVMPETVAMKDRLLAPDNRSEFHDMYTEAWTQKQDTAHFEFFETWRRWASPIVKVPANFTYQYPTAGASEALRELIGSYGNDARVAGYQPTIHMFAGEYEGFSAYAKAAGIPIKTHDRAKWQETAATIGPRDQFYLSHPSAIDGNVWPDYDRFMQAVSANQPTAQVIIDLTYVGAVAREFTINLECPAIRALCFSLSKPCGMYYDRCGGLVSRNPYLGLFGNVWFKNLYSLKLGTQMMQAHGVYHLPRKYRSAAQVPAARRASEALGFPIEPCDVFILGISPVRPNQTELEQYLTRAAGGSSIVRVCLTPRMAKIIDPRASSFVKARITERFEPGTPQ